VLAMLTTFATSACFVHRSEEPPAPLRSPARDSLLAVDAARGEAATQQGLTKAAATWLDSAVIYLRAGAPIVYGRSNALMILGDSTSDRTRYQWRPLGGGLSRDGRAGYTYGVATIATSSPQGAPSVRSDRYVAFWRRAADGVWRIAAYADVGGPPLSGAVSVPNADFPLSSSALKGSRADAVRAVRSADSAFALAADLQGTGVAFASYIAPEGVVFVGSEIVIGSDAVRVLYDEQQRAGGTLNWRPIYADAAASGDLGFTIGESVFTGRGINGTVVQRFGKYLTIWKKQPGGEWRFVVDGGNVSPTPNR
jgi:ketosteroid isomerase-like protein